MCTAVPNKCNANERHTALNSTHTTNLNFFQQMVLISKLQPKQTFKKRTHCRFQNTALRLLSVFQPWRSASLLIIWIFKKNSSRYLIIYFYYMSLLGPYYLILSVSLLLKSISYDHFYYSSQKSNITEIGLSNCIFSSRWLPNVILSLILFSYLSSFTSPSWLASTISNLFIFVGISISMQMCVANNFTVLIRSDMQSMRMKK